MQTTDTTLSPDLAPAKPDWDFLEVWVDPFLSPPYILLLLGDEAGPCRIYSPAENHKLIFSSATYPEAEIWLLEDEYEPLQGRLNAPTPQG